MPLHEHNIRTDCKGEHGAISIIGTPSEWACRMGGPCQGEKSEVATAELGGTLASQNVLRESPWKEKNQKSTHEMGEIQMMVIF